MSFKEPPVAVVARATVRLIPSCSLRPVVQHKVAGNRYQGASHRHRCGDQPPHLVTASSSRPFSAGSRPTITSTFPINTGCRDYPLLHLTDSPVTKYLYLSRYPRANAPAL